MSPGDHPAGRLAGEPWHRLHPRSPMVRAGRGALAILVVLAGSALGGSARGNGDLYRLVAIGVAFAAGLVSWLVTRWRVEGGVLRIESGLLRRSSQRLPLNQIQAVDTVSPGMARMFRLAEVRVRMAGAKGSSGRLAYLATPQAEALRARLLALAHGVAEDSPAPPEQQLLSVPTGQLLTSLLLGGGGVVVVAMVAGLALLTALAPAAAGAVAGASVAVLVGSAGATWQRFNGEYHLTLAESPDGLRVRAGLVERSAETIPRGRVQGLRLVEPLLWRPLGWCRVEVEVAGKSASGRRDRAARRASRAILPVGSRAQAAWLIDRVMAGAPTDRRRPPRRARLKSPLRFQNLAWAVNQAYAVTASGRLRRATDWVPLSKVQSIRWVQGPLQRRLGLASIHLDTAGRNVHAVLRDAGAAEAAEAMATLPGMCRTARSADGRPGDHLARVRRSSGTDRPDVHPGLGPPAAPPRPSDPASI